MSYFAPLTNELRETRDRSYLVPLVESRNLRPNSSIIPGTGGLRWVYDSTSLRLLQGCLRKANWVLNDNWTETTRPIALEFGIYLHTCLETYHKCQAHGLDHEVAIRRVARLAMLLGENFQSLDTSRSKETLVRSVVWYLDQYEHDPLKTAMLPGGKPAVELSYMLPVFDIKVGPTDELPILEFQDVLDYCDGNYEKAIIAVAQGRKLFGSLCWERSRHNFSCDPAIIKRVVDSFSTITIHFAGHLDRVVHFGDEVFVLDYKTSKYALDAPWVTSFDRSLQFRGYFTAAYILASQPNTVFPRPPAGVLVDGIQLQVNATRFARFPLRYWESTADEFLHEFEMLIRAKVEPATRLGYWPSEAESECNHYRRRDGGGGCAFLEVCNAPVANRERLLNQHFKKSVWDPSQSR